MLAFTGVVILMAHPRLYWGEVGNELTPAILELPISRNHRHNGWGESVAFYDREGAPVSAVRTIRIFNQNGWGRSLHFLAAWLLFATGVIYLAAGFCSGHFRHHLLPRRSELKIRAFQRELRDHLALRIRTPTGGPQYGLFQKSAYLLVVFVAAPLIVASGLAMSPAITATFPFVLDVFGGFQTARTLHFFGFAVLMLFMALHLSMVLASGVWRQLRAITVGEGERE